MQTIAFTITNITCGACVKLSTSALKKLPGVQTVVIAEDTGHGELTTSEALTPEQIVHALSAVKKTVSDIKF